MEATEPEWLTEVRARCRRNAMRAANNPRLRKAAEEFEAWIQAQKAKAPVRAWQPQKTDAEPTPWRGVERTAPRHIREAIK